MIASPSGQVASLHPSAIYCIIQQQVVSLTSSTFISFCINMHNTRPHPCTPPHRLSGVNEYLLHVGHSRVLNESSLDMSLKMLNVLIYISLCLVYTVQPLDNNFITCVINIHIYEHGRKGFEKDI